MIVRQKNSLHFFVFVILKAYCSMSLWSPLAFFYPINNMFWKCLFGYVACITTEKHPFRMKTFNPLPRLRRVQQSLTINCFFIGMETPNEKYLSSVWPLYNFCQMACKVRNNKCIVTVNPSIYSTWLTFLIIYCYGFLIFSHSLFN